MNFDKASNALVTVTGFYADALADLTGQRDSLMEQRSLLAKELQATQACDNSLRMVLDAAQQYLDGQSNIIPGTPIAKLYDVVSKCGVTNAQR